jgi:hypothetical protein
MGSLSASARNRRESDRAVEKRSAAGMKRGSFFVGWPKASDQQPFAIRLAAVQLTLAP